MVDNKESGESWGKNIGIFVAGVVVGAVGTAAVGHLTGKVPVPAAMANALGGGAAKPA